MELMDLAVEFMRHLFNAVLQGCFFAWLIISLFSPKKGARTLWVVIKILHGICGGMTPSIITSERVEYPEETGSKETV